MKKGLCNWGGKAGARLRLSQPWLEWRNPTLQWCILISVMHCYSLLCSFLHCQYGSLSGVTQCYSFTLRLCILAIVLHCCNLQCSSEKLHSALAFHWNRDLFVLLEVPQSAVTLCLAQILSFQPWDTSYKYFPFKYFLLTNFYQILSIQPWDNF